MAVYCNTSNRPIGIGPVTLMPGDIKSIPDDYAKNPVVKGYIKRGLLTSSRKTVVVPEVKGDAESRTKEGAGQEGKENAGQEGQA